MHSSHIRLQRLQAIQAVIQYISVLVYSYRQEFIIIEVNSCYRLQGLQVYYKKNIMYYVHTGYKGYKLITNNTMYYVSHLGFQEISM